MALSKMDKKLRILFIAHDIGGGNLLASVAERAFEEGHKLDFVAGGPSVSLWREREFDPIPVNVETSEDALREMIEQLSPNVIVTGTSVATSFEHRAWSAARELGLPTLAMVDGWVKIPDRFLKDDPGRSFPDRVGVVDEATVQMLAETCQISSELIDIIGHPHLQRVAYEVTAARAAREENERLTVAFFSTPIVDTEAKPGVATAAKLLPLLEVHAPLHLIIKPHPREALGPWRAWMADAAEISPNVTVELAEKKSAADLLKTANAVLGLPTSVLVEAAFAGAPVLVLRFEARSYANPAIDLYLRGKVVERAEELPSHLSQLFSVIGKMEQSLANSATENADRRALQAIEALAKE
jgi:hypothetical protein